MKLKINGDFKTIENEESEISLSNLIKELGQHPRLVVVELNGTIISPKKWDCTKAKDGDTLEIVTIVGGGS